MDDDPPEPLVPYDCPGEGKCHGCLKWCDLCGDVAYVCDSPECDSHLREDELLTMISISEKEIREDAAQCREYELRLRHLRHEGVETYQTMDKNKRNGRGPWVHEHQKARSLTDSVRSNERELLRVEEELASLRFWRSKGCVMVPR